MVSLFDWRVFRNQNSLCLALGNVRMKFSHMEGMIPFYFENSHATITLVWFIETPFLLYMIVPVFFGGELGVTERAREHLDASVGIFVNNKVCPCFEPGTKASR
jgi:hypothetical protein